MEMFLQHRKLICMKYKIMSNSIIPQNHETVIELEILYIIMATQKGLLSF